MINEQLQAVLLITSIIGLVFVFRFVKKKLLNLKYSFLWIVMGFVFLALSIYPEIIDGVREALGIQLGSNALFFLGICFLIFLSFSLTVIVSKHAERMRRLNQELALLRRQVDDLKRGVQ